MPHAVNPSGQVSNFAPTDPTEKRNCTFDFTKGLSPGEAIVGIPTWSILVYDGVDPTPNARLIGAAQVFGNIAMQLVGTCIAGVRYSLVATATTSTGETLTAFAELACAPVT